MKQLLLALILAQLASSQETPTERQAAKDVVARLNTLEKSLNIDQLVTKITAPNAERDKVVKRANPLMDTEMLQLGDQITRDPEIEEHVVKLLMQRLTKYGFEPEAGIAGMQTAFIRQIQTERRSGNAT